MSVSEGGRWRDPAASGVVSRPPATAPAGVSVIYIGGFGRSGSTLIERMLGAVPGWINVGEVVDLARSVSRADELCGCGVPFSRCPLWSRVGQVAFGGWTVDVLDRLAALHRSAARQRHLPSLLLSRGTSSDALADLRAAYTAIYRAVADVAGATVVVDASKGPALGQALAGAAGLDLRMLNVVRDPRAVAWSWSRRVERPHAATGAEQMWRISAPRSALQWGALQLEMEAIARLGDVSSARLRYEDFVEDPVTSLVGATAALGIAVEPTDLPAVVAGRVDLGPSHGLSGNPARFDSGSLELRRDDRWATQMPVTDRVTVSALTLPLLAAYGYPVSKPGPAPGRRDRHEMRSTT